MAPIPDHKTSNDFHLLIQYPDSSNDLMDDHNVEFLKSDQPTLFL